MLSRSVLQRLGDLIRGEASAREDGTSRNGAGTARNGAGGLRSAVGGREIVRSGIDEILPGGVLEGSEGNLFVHERLYTELGEHPSPLFERFAELCSGEWGDDDRRRPVVARDLPAAAAAVDPPERGLFRRYGFRKMLFLDIETGGLAAAPVFLVGLCIIGDRDLVLRQLFARDYGEERALLREVERLARGFDFLVTFNGKTFDVPYLRDRATHHRMEWSLDLPHLDLLWMARRRWKEHLPDCRLKTLEWHVLRRRRAGDVMGAEIPGLYHDYVRRGEPHRLLPVFHHNLLDVVAMVELIPAIFDPETQIY